MPLPDNLHGRLAAGEVVAYTVNYVNVVEVMRGTASLRIESVAGDPDVNVIVGTGHGESEISISRAQLNTVIGQLALRDFNRVCPA